MWLHNRVHLVTRARLDGKCCELLGRRLCGQAGLYYLRERISCCARLQHAAQGAQARAQRPCAARPLLLSGRRPPPLACSHADMPGPFQESCTKASMQLWLASARVPRRTQERSIAKTVMSSALHETGLNRNLKPEKFLIMIKCPVHPHCLRARVPGGGWHTVISGLRTNRTGHRALQSAQRSARSRPPCIQVIVVQLATAGGGHRCAGGAFSNFRVVGFRESGLGIVLGIGHRKAHSVAPAAGPPACQVIVVQLAACRRRAPLTAAHSLIFRL